MFLAIDYTKPIENVGDKFAFGGQMLLIGMSVVFSVLVILWGALELFHLIVAKVTNAAEKKKAAPEEDLPAPTVTAPTDADDDELIAVLAAAIAAAETEAPGKSFRVVSFRRV